MKTSEVSKEMLEKWKEDYKIVKELENNDIVKRYCEALDIYTILPTDEEYITYKTMNKANYLIQLPRYEITYDKGIELSGYRVYKKNLEEPKYLTCYCRIFETKQEAEEYLELKIQEDIKEHLLKESENTNE